MNLDVLQSLPKAVGGLSFCSMLIALISITSPAQSAGHRDFGRQSAALAADDDDKDGAAESSKTTNNDDHKNRDGKNLETKKAESSTAKPNDKVNNKANEKASDDSKISDRPVTFSGNASWYGIPFHGRKTANGEIFNMYRPSAAHLTLPLPTKALVEDPRSGNAVIVRVNDRGPYVKTRVMDLSREAARNLGTLSRGVAYIEVTILERPKPKSKKSS